jgi:hypothetical protein
MMVYKIRRSDGLYSTGGTFPSFNKTGKTWNMIHHLKRHLDNLGSERAMYVYGDCLIVEYVESGCSIPIDRIVDEVESRAIERERERAERRLRRLEALVQKHDS